MEGTMATIVGWAPVWAPRTWMSCSGQLLPISNFNALFSLIGTLYGGDGRTTFGLPDLRGRVPMGSGSGPGLTPRSNGQSGGAEYVTLTVLEIPSHNHSASFSSGSSMVIPAINNADGTTNTPSSNVYPAVGKAGTGLGAQNTDIYTTGTPNTQIGPNIPVTGNISVNYTGGNQSHLNLQPYQVILWIICYQGIYPSRN